jgi:FAD/FMN-containing dehydrogenase
MDEFIQKLKIAGFRGEVDNSDETRQLYSHDASLFELLPQLVVSPQDSVDLQTLVRAVAAEKKLNRTLSLTARSGGTCMSGGAINDSIIVDFSKHFTAIEEVTSVSARVQPGVFYRDFEPKTLERGAILPSFPASRELCTIGGMVANDSGGEMSLEYGKTENYVTELKMVLADGKEYTFKPLNKSELDQKRKQRDFEGELYRSIYNLCVTRYDQIKAAKPHVSKNSTGYNIWDVYDRQTETFDLTKLIVGSQGTLGMVTDVKFRLVPKRNFSGVLVCFLKDTSQLGEIINEVLKRKPATFESFDNYTLNLSIKFFPYFRKTLGWGGLVKLGLQLIPDALLLFKGIPKLVMLVEFTGASQEEVDQKLAALKEALAPFKLQATEEENTPAKAWKFRIMRRESFNLLRKKVKDKHTAPFIDDLVVPPQFLPQFLPRLRQIINKYMLMATVAGHMGDGNFHVIPLMKLEDPAERAKLLPAMREVNELVLSYHGSLSGEHNDGLIRGPWLEQMYGADMVKIFKEVKHIFDPENIFNPHKKTDANWDFSFSHIRNHF